MANTPLREMEELVRQSVFHPSPCKQLREEVIRDAYRAYHAQRFGKRFLGTCGCIAGFVLLVALTIKLWPLAAASPPQAAEVSAPSANDAVEAELLKGRSLIEIIERQQAESR